MMADVLPALSAASGLDLQATVAAWEKARASALRQTHGYDDTRTYVLTVEGFRQSHPFSYADLGAAFRELPVQRGPSAAPATTP